MSIEDAHPDRIALTGDRNFRLPKITQYRSISTLRALIDPARFAMAFRATLQQRFDPYRIPICYNSHQYIGVLEPCSLRLYCFEKADRN